MFHCARKRDAATVQRVPQGDFPAPERLPMIKGDGIGKLPGIQIDKSLQPSHNWGKHATISSPSKAAKRQGVNQSSAPFPAMTGFPGWVANIPRQFIKRLLEPKHNLDAGTISNANKAHDIPTKHNVISVFHLVFNLWLI